MKLKYYLRGLGIGIVFSTLIASFGKTSAVEPMTDQKVIERAKELGMVERTVLADTEADRNESLEETTQETRNDVKESLEETENLSESETDKMATFVESEESEWEESAETTNQEETQPVQEETVVKPTEEFDKESEEETKESTVGGEILVVEIPSGSGSYETARILADYGLVSDAAKYDQFLCANGYDRKIRSGIYEIPVGADDVTIAEVICSLNVRR